MENNNNNKNSKNTSVFSQDDLSIDYNDIKDDAPFDINSIAPAVLDSLGEFIFVTDSYSKKIVYINKPLSDYLKIYKSFSDSCATCYSLLRGRKTSCENCTVNLNCVCGETLVHNSLKAGVRRFQVTCRKVKVNDHVYNIMICTPAITNKHLSEIIRENPDQADAIAQIVGINTANADSPNMQINALLRFFCSYFRGERAYYFFRNSKNPDPESSEKHDKYCCISYFSRVDDKDITELNYTGGYRFLDTAFSQKEKILIKTPKFPDDPQLEKWFKDEGLERVLIIPYVYDSAPRGAAIIFNPDPETTAKNQYVLGLAESAINSAALSLSRHDTAESEIYIDPLTKLRNRTALLEDINKLFTQKDIGVISLNINGLKVINETYGFKEGDSIIIRVGSLLKQLLPSSTSIYRSSGDEFMVIYPNVTEQEFKSVSDMLKAFMANERGFSAAVGGFWVHEGYQLQHAVNQADNSMMETKRMYYHTVPADSRYRYTKDLVLDIISPVKISKLISNNNFMVYYQPKVCIKGDHEAITSAEALIRLQFNGSIISPNEFIPPLEASHYTHLIDFFVLNTICRRMRERLDKGLKVIPVSCNFSRHSAVRPDFIESVKKIVKDYNIDPSSIIIEISERSQTFFKNELISSCVNLSKAGFKISIDDFGVAHANLWVLSDLPVSEIKFDKRLIDSLLNPDNKKIRVILSEMTRMCRELKIGTVAEGVEKPIQRDALKEIGIDEIQGYFYSKPIPQDDFYKLFDSGKVHSGV